MIKATAYFTDRNAIHQYYNAYGYDYNDIEELIYKEEVFVGKPPLLKDEIIESVNINGRYNIRDMTSEEKDERHREQIKKTLDEADLSWFEGKLIGHEKTKIRGVLKVGKSNFYMIENTDTKEIYAFSSKDIIEFKLNDKWPKEYLDKYNCYKRKTYKMSYERSLLHPRFEKAFKCNITGSIKSTPCKIKENNIKFTDSESHELNDWYQNFLKDKQEIEMKTGLSIEELMARLNREIMQQKNEMEYPMKAEMLNCTDCEGLEKAEYEIKLAGSNKKNTTIKTDSEGRKIVVKVLSEEAKLDLCKEIRVSKRYNLDLISATIEDGIIKIAVPTNEGVVKTVEIC